MTTNIPNLLLSRDAFRDGDPPHPGWYVTKEPDQPTDPRDYQGLRWWTGTCWGPWFHKNHTAAQVAFHFNKSRCPKPTTRYKWSLIWPDDARVARVDPKTGRVTGNGPCPYRTAGLPWPFA